MSKNNPEKRGKAAEAKKHNDKVVKPVFYYGKHKNHGNYMAAQYENGDLAVDPVTKKPIAYGQI